LGGSASLTWNGTVLTSSGFAGPLNGTVGATTPNTGSFTTLTTSSTITDNGGTANGVTYLNGSKVVTSGSVLTFDGTNFATSNSMRVTGNTASYASGAGTEITYIAGSTKGGIQVYDRTASAYKDVFLDGANALFQISGTERMRIDSSGNLLVGVTIGSGFRQRITQSAGNWLHFNSDTVEAKISGGSTWNFNTDSGNPISFSISSTERARIDSSGNLLVGTTSGAGRFTVNGSTADNTANCISFRDTSATSLFVLRNDGRISTGGALSPYNNTTGSSANMVVDASGIFYRSTSSLKYKKNVQNATHGLTELLSLRPVTYEGKSEADVGKIFGGLIAEEVHAAGLTEFVQYAKDGSPDALAYGNMISLCVKAIQELKAEFDAYKASHP
jgi:hypothetical protein